MTKQYEKKLIELAKEVQKLMMTGSVSTNNPVFTAANILIGYILALEELSNSDIENDQRTTSNK